MNRKAPRVLSILTGAGLVLGTSLLAIAPANAADDPTIHSIYQEVFNEQLDDGTCYTTLYVAGTADDGTAGTISFGSVAPTYDGPIGPGSWAYVFELDSLGAGSHTLTLTVTQTAPTTQVVYSQDVTFTVYDGDCTGNGGDDDGDDGGDGDNGGDDGDGGDSGNQGDGDGNGDNNGGTTPGDGTGNDGTPSVSNPQTPEGATGDVLANTGVPVQSWLVGSSALVLLLLGAGFVLRRRLAGSSER